MYAMLSLDMTPRYGRCAWDPRGRPPKLGVMGTGGQGSGTLRDKISNGTVMVTGAAHA